LKIDFEKPPINEVSIGMHFAPVINLRAEHVGLFWNRVRADFPSAQQAPLVGGVVQIPPELLPIPRFWFIAKDDATLIQLQKNLFLFNWRLRAADYPRFENVFDAFRKHRSTFIQFLKTELNTTKIEQVKYELTYVNLFEDVPYWSGFEDTQRVIPSFAPIDSGLKNAKAKDFNYTTIFQLAEDLSLNLAIRNGLNNTTNRPVLALNLEATGTHARFEVEKADGWYPRAHAAISECFVAVTNRQIQKEYWIPK
jgi:uncharacterized protein (TIGR04255 family)